MSILTAWSPFFHSSARMRGRAHFSNDRVERVPPAEDELIRAHVQDSDEQHIVTIRQDEQRAEAECTCAHFEKGAYCKHIWAVLLDLQHREGPGASADHLARLRVRAPKARKRAGAGRRPMRDTEPEWMGRLSLLRPATSGDSGDASGHVGLPVQRQICYVVLPEASMRHQGLVVELRQRTPTATGWSKAKPLKIDAPTLATLSDPVDRELCALLLGGAPPGHESMAGSTTRGEATYRLPPGAWRTILQRMIATHRCFIADDDDGTSGGERPLRWAGGQPWTLWMVGRESENGDELLVHVELRRGSDEPPLPIEAPAMVLGGVDGVVIWEDQAAPLDDRDAYRWVSHFRDEQRRRDEHRPIRVPKADVERFLDRLYMLPELPEIDLPEGIGRVPQHVEPIAHLDLFSPGSREAQQVLPASAKNQLAAKVWFAYDGQRVSPGQPGRFVTISSSASINGTIELDETPVTDNGNDHDENTAAHDWGEHSAIASSNGNGDDEESNRDNENEDSETAEAPPAEGLLIQRNRRIEREAMAQLAAQGFRPLSGAGPDTLALPSKQMPETVATLLAQGWVVSADRQLVRHAATPNVSVTSGVDWFELRGRVRYQRADGTTQDVPLPQILNAARRGEHMVELDDGTQGLLPDAWLSEHSMLTAMGQLKEDHLRFGASQAALLDALLREQELVEVDEPFERLRARLHQFRGVHPIEPSPQFKGSLRPYQREGLGWMALLRWFGMGGVLADDMGLGKTIQVLAMLQMRVHEHQSESSGTHRPSLVVAPRSVVFNWVDEAEKFTNDLRVMAYAGGEREALRAAFEEHDLIVTSYGLLRRDIEALRHFDFDYLILDEAQAIKNPQSQAAKSARLLQGAHRLALTGTPVENHLGDLWSIFEFLNPGMLGASTRFNDLVRAGTQANSSNGNGSNGHAEREALEQVGRALRPFILRRTKKQVLADLPDKTEQTLRCEMEPPQRKIYDDLRAYYRSHLLNRLDQVHGDSGTSTGPTIGGKAGFMVLEALLRLRQAACHPGLINNEYADEPSAKLDVLMELLEDVIAEGSKALIFSQFTSMLSLVKRRFDERKIRHCYLDGQTRNRREVVHRFQTDPQINAFLVSLKTGGFGLNLTAAEYVFILDPWWNPAVEQQAIDRTHRIGQTRRVFAYRLICQDTVEQRITELQAQKRQIADAIVGGEQHVLSNLTREDLEQLLS
ncbi:MAG: SNF2-related protein [Phycisphaeraceae bacterium]